MSRQGSPRTGAGAVLMVRPSSFGFNPETAGSNAFQHEVPSEGVAHAARREVDGVASALEGAGIRVCVVEDPPDAVRPDAVFPNNWIAFHPGGTVALFPMEAPSRRVERREAVVAEVLARTGYVERRRLDLTAHEARGRFLEGTGSLVLDPLAPVAFACRSSRTDPVLADSWAREMGYELELFSAFGPRGLPVYHTNVILAIGTRWALYAEELVAVEDRDRVLERLQRDDRTLIPIDAAQVGAFSGNVLELDGEQGPVVVMSAGALRALPWSALDAIERHARVLSVDVPTIEAVGGGGVRCMLCEVFA